MNATGLFDATIHQGIAIGSCVMICDDEIVYAGPLKTAPNADGKMVLLSADDFAKLESHVKARRH